MVVLSPKKLNIPEQFYVSVDKPCLLLVREVFSINSKSKYTNTSMILTVSNPDHVGIQVEVIVPKILKGPACTPYKGKTKILFILPTGDFQGKSISIACEY